MAYEYVVMGLLAYSLLYTVIGILALFTLGVLIYSLNIGLKNSNLVGKITDSKFYTVAYRILYIGGFIVSLTLVMLPLFSSTAIFITSIFTPYVVALIIAFSYHAIVTSHRYHLTDFIGVDDTTKSNTDEVTL